MTWTQKFLLLFSDYVALRDRCQRLDDEILTLRAQKEDAESRAEKWAEDAVKREREITERMWVLRTERPTPPLIHERVREAKNEFREAITQYAGLKLA